MPYPPALVAHAVVTATAAQPEAIQIRQIAEVGVEDDGGGDIAGRAGTVVAVVATSVWCLAAIGSPALAITAACAATAAILAVVR